MLRLKSYSSARAVIPTNNGVIMNKKFVIITSIIAVFCFACYLILRPAMQAAKSSSLRVMCVHIMHNLDLSIREYIHHEGNEKPPFFGNCDGTEEYWSWRVWIRRTHYNDYCPLTRQFVPEKLFHHPCYHSCCWILARLSGNAKGKIVVSSGNVYPYYI